MPPVSTPNKEKRYGNLANVKSVSEPSLEVKLLSIKAKEKGNS